MTTILSRKQFIAALSLVLMCLALVPAQEASAQRRFAARGANGGAAGFAQRFQNGGGAAAFGGRFKNSAGGAYAAKGQYGSAVGGAVATPYGGGGFHKDQFAGPNGGNFQSTGGGAYKPGVGAFRKNEYSGTAANGATGSGNSNMQYNAQTGQGTRNSSNQFTSATGQNYGDTGSTTFAKGQGGNTELQTDNHGSYDINWAKGQKPVITQESAPQ